MLLRAEGAAAGQEVGHVAALIARIHAHMPGHVADADPLAHARAPAGDGARQGGGLGIDQVQDGRGGRAALIQKARAPVSLRLFQRPQQIGIESGVEPADRIGQVAAQRGRNTDVLGVADGPFHLRQGRERAGMHARQTVKVGGAGRKRPRQQRIHHAGLDPHRLARHHDFLGDMGGGMHAIGGALAVPGVLGTHGENGQQHQHQSAGDQPQQCRDRVGVPHQRPWPTSLLPA